MTTTLVTANLHGTQTTNQEKYFHAPSQLQDKTNLPNKLQDRQ